MFPMFPNEFLVRARRHLLDADQFDKINIVMGNEASDADSIISSIALAWSSSVSLCSALLCALQKVLSSHDFCAMKLSRDVSAVCLNCGSKLLRSYKVCLRIHCLSLLGA